MKINLDKVSSEYLPNGATEIENKLILNWYPHRIISRFNRVTSLLELGLGHGITTKIFATACDHHVVIDGSSVVIEHFHKTCPEFHGEIIKAYFEEFTPKKKFDVIVMGFILEHVDDPIAILKRYREFLKPEGKLYVTVPNGKSLNRRIGFELGMIEDLYSLNENDLTLGHQRQFCRDTLKSTIEVSGYRVTYEEGIYLKPLPLGILKKLKKFDENLQAMLKVGINFPDICVGLMMELEVL